MTHKAKKFTRTKPKPKQTKKGDPTFFCFNEAWAAEPIEFVIIDKKTGEVSPINMYDSSQKPYLILHLIVGRSRYHRYIASNGTEYYDLVGTKLGSPSRRRCWSEQEGPWKVLEEPQLKHLNQNAKAVIEAVIKAVVNNQSQVESK